MKNCLITYDQSVVTFTSEQFLAFIRENRYVNQWSCPFDGVYIIKTDSDVGQLKDSIKLFTGPYASFIITEVDPSSTAGLLPISIWDWFNEGVLPDDLVARIKAARRPKLASPDA